MAFPPREPPGPSNSGPSFHHSSSGRHAAGNNAFSNSYFAGSDDQFDIFDWHPHFQSCVKYFLEKAQHTAAVQAVATLINIRLPFQRSQHPSLGSAAGGPVPGAGGPTLSSRFPGQAPWVTHPNNYVSLNPYIRRLVATGWDLPDILHGFFGDDWAQGIGPIHEVERRNYLFAAKSASWLKVKTLYDMDEDESIPYLRPLQNVTEKEIVSAEKNWSEWLAMQDWMIGPRSPEEDGEKNENQ